MDNGFEEFAGVLTFLPLLSAMTFKHNFLLLNEVIDIPRQKVAKMAIEKRQPIEKQTISVSSRTQSRN